MPQRETRLLLANSTCIVLQPLISKELGRPCAVVLQQIHYFLQTNSTEHNSNPSLKWVKISVDSLVHSIHVYSRRTINRALKKLKDVNILFSNNFSKNKSDRTNWYSIDYTGLQSFLDSSQAQFSSSYSEQLTQSQCQNGTLVIKETIKQINKQVSLPSFEKSLEKEGEGHTQPFLKPTPLEDINFETEKERWEDWAQEEFSWDKETILTEIKRFFKHHLKKQSLFIDWFKAWKGWCQMSFNALKKAFMKDSSKEIEKKRTLIVENASLQKDRVGEIDPVQQEIKDKLIKFGLNEAKSTMLLEKFESSRILKNLAYVNAKEEGKGIRNKLGYLLKAIFEDYACTYEENTGQKVEIQKTQAIIQEEEKILLQAIEEGEGGELSKKVHKAFLKTLGVSVYASWFKNVNIDRSSDTSDKETFILKMESSFCAEWVSTHFREKIRNIFKNLFPSASEIQLIGLNSIYPHKIGL